MLFSAIFSIAVGVLMIIQWIITIARGNVQSLEAGSTAGRGRTEMMFHWVAEFGTSLMLLLAGIGLLVNSTWALIVFYIATGMLIYTVINSPGYFAQQKQWPMVSMFSVILILAIVSIVLVI